MMLTLIFFMLFTLVDASFPDNAVLYFPSPDITFPIYDTITVSILFNTSMRGVQQSAFTSVLLPNGTLQSVGSDMVGCDGDLDSDGDLDFMIFLPGTYTIFWNVTYNTSLDPFQANSTSCGPGPYSTMNWLLNSTFTASWGTTSVPPNVVATRTLSSEPTGSVPIVNPLLPPPPPPLNETDGWDQEGIAEEAAWLYRVLLSRFTQFSAAALIVYDVLLTVDDEIELVWRRTWGLPVFIYLANRYLVLMQTLGLLAIVLADELIGNVDSVGLPIVTGSGEQTQLVLAFNYWLSLSVPLTILIVEAMITMRVIALWNNNRRLSLSLWVLYIGTGVASLTIMGIELSHVTPTLQSPWYGIIIDDWYNVGPSYFSPMFLQTNFLFAAAWVPGLVMEMVLVIATVVRGIHHSRKAVKTPLLTILIRDGVVYFIVVFALMLSNLVLSLYAYLVPSSSYLNSGTIVELTLCVASILCSRLFLSLRRAAYGRQIQTSQLSHGEHHELYSFGRGSEGHAQTGPSLLGTLGGYSEEYR